MLTKRTLIHRESYSRQVLSIFSIYMNWTTPNTQKNFIRTLTYRCMRICSSPCLLQSVLDDLKKYFYAMGIPVVLFLIT